MVVAARSLATKIADRCRRAHESMLFYSVYRRYIRYNQRVSFILHSDWVRLVKLATDERDWPGNPRLKAQGWSDIMLLRYALAMRYGKGKMVLDSCCGFGWGAYLLDGVANRTIAIDNDSGALSVAKKLWPTRNTEYINASVLDMPFPPGTFDLVTAMESIEHFPAHQIKPYLCEIARVLKPGGLLIGSSVFPETPVETEFIRTGNPNHLHILTRQEMIDRLNECGYTNAKIFANHLFFSARKRESPGNASPTSAEAPPETTRKPPQTNCLRPIEVPAKGGQNG